MYHSLDLLISESSSYKHIAEQHRRDINDLETAFDVVKKFIIKKKRIIYGGMSIDLALRAAGKAGIYGDDTIPDYDFMSPDAYGDSIELAQDIAAEFLSRSGDKKKGGAYKKEYKKDYRKEYKREGVKELPQVSAINALHPTTRRVRIGFTPVADVTHYPSTVYDSLPTIEYKGFRVIHPTFQRLDMHRAFTVPMENPPREVVFYRMRKDIKRFDLLDQTYPIDLDSVLDQKKANVGELGKLVLDSGKLEKYLNGGVLGGIVAYALMAQKDTLCPIVATVDSGTITITYPKQFENLMCVNILSDQFLSVRDSIVTASKTTAPVTYRHRYLEDLKSRSVEVTQENVIWDIHDVRGKLTPYGEITELPGIKIATIHSICLYFLAKHFIPSGSSGSSGSSSSSLPESKDDRNLWMWLYWSALQILKKLKLDAYKVDLYGFHNWSYSYLINAHKQYAQITGADVKNLPNARPPHGYYIELESKEKKVPEIQPFDPKTSWVFQMDGSITDEFIELDPRQFPSIENTKEKEPTKKETTKKETTKKETTKKEKKDGGGGNSTGGVMSKLDLDELPILREEFDGKTFEPIYSAKQLSGTNSKLRYRTKSFMTTGCHAGQRKLLLTEIQFYTALESDTDLIIYAGSASGDHTDVILKMFPSKKLILIDPAYHSIDADYIMLYQNLEVVNKKNLVVFASNTKSKNPIVAAHHRRLLNAPFYGTLSRDSKDSKDSKKKMKSYNILETALDYMVTSASDPSHRDEKNHKNKAVSEIIEQKKYFETEGHKTIIKDIIDDTEHRVFIIQDYLTPELADLLSLSLEHAPKGQKVAFVSDLRSIMFDTLPSDMDYVWNDALHIYTIKKIRPVASMLKFHPPYFDQREPYHKLLKSDLPHHKKMLQDIKKVQDTDMMDNYSKGIHMFFDSSQIWLQAWAPTHSSETRLIVDQKDIDKPFINYPHDVWDNQFYYFNRLRTYGFFDAFYPLLATTRGNVYDGCLDCMLEIFILGNYLLSGAGTKVGAGKTKEPKKEPKKEQKEPKKEQKEPKEPKEPKEDEKYKMDWKAVQAKIKQNPAALLRLSKQIDDSFPYPSMRSNKCGFHDQITKPLIGLYVYKRTGSTLYRIEVSTGESMIVDPKILQSLRLAQNIFKVSPTAQASVRRYIAQSSD